MLTLLLACSSPPSDLPATLSANGPCDEPAAFGTRADVEAADDGIDVNSRLGPAGLELFATIPVGTFIETELVLQDGILWHLACGDGLRAEIDLEAFTLLQAGVEASGQGTHLAMEASTEGVFQVQGSATVTPTRVQSSGCDGLVAGEPIEVPLTFEITVIPSTVTVATENPECDVWLSDRTYLLQVYDGAFRDRSHSWVGRGGVQVCHDGQLHLQGSGSLDLVVDGTVQRTVIVRAPAEVDEVGWSLFDAAGRSGMDDRVSISAMPGGTVYVQELVADGLEVCKGEVTAQVSSLSPQVCELGSYPPLGFPIDNNFPRIDGQRIEGNLILIQPGVCTVQLEVEEVLGGAGLTEERRFDVD